MHKILTKNYHLLIIWLLVGCGVQTDFENSERIDEMTYEIRKTNSILLEKVQLDSSWTYGKTVELMDEITGLVAEASGGYHYPDNVTRLQKPANTIDSDLQKACTSKIRVRLTQDINRETNVEKKRHLEELLDEFFSKESLGSSAMEIRLKLYIAQSRLIAIDQLGN